MSYGIILNGKRRENRLIPIIPKSKEFKRALRNQLLKDWDFAAHYVDSAIKTAYSILKSCERLRGGSYGI